MRTVFSKSDRRECNVLLKCHNIPWEDENDITFNRKHFHLARNENGASRSKEPKVDSSSVVLYLRAS